MVDQKGLTALAVVKEMPSQKSREIAALILGEGRWRKPPQGGGSLGNAVAEGDAMSCLPATTGHMTGKPPDIELPPPPIPPPQESPRPRKKSKPEKSGEPRKRLNKLAPNEPSVVSPRLIASPLLF